MSENLIKWKAAEQRLTGLKRKERPLEVSEEHQGRPIPNRPAGFHLCHGVTALPEGLAAPCRLWCGRTTDKPWSIPDGLSKSRQNLRDRVNGMVNDTPLVSKLGQSLHVEAESGKRQRGRINSAPWVMLAHEDHVVCDGRLAGGHCDGLAGRSQLNGGGLHRLGAGPVVALPRHADLFFNTGSDRAFQPTTFGLHFLLLLFVVSSLEPIC